MTAYYNEIDPYAAEWLRNLIAAGHIAPGDVDTRDIRDVRPSDLRGYTQCHFFAGVGVWSYSLRRAGWGDDRPVWTGSCPCQPFSAAGAGLGFSDERHLWPHWHWLISECRPAVVLGEQVASKDADPWIDLVCDDLEALDYAVGAVPFPSAGVGAPHIRDRLYWVAHTNGSARGKGRAHVRGRLDGGNAESRPRSGRGGLPSGMADDSGIRFVGAKGFEPVGSASRGTPGEAWEQRLRAELGASSGGTGGLADAKCHAGRREAESANHQWPQADGPTDRAGGRGGASGGLADAHGWHTSAERQQRSWEQRQQQKDSGRLQDGPAGPTNGHWRTADWLLCRDGKWRPVEPGTFPLADGAPARVGRLRAYGNAINAEAARVWVECVMESI